MKQKWNYVPFEDAVEIWDIKRKPINNAERASRINGKSNNELYPYYGATGQVGFIDDYLTDGEYVLLGEDGASFLNPIAQKAYIVTGKTWVNNHAHVLKSKYNNKFLCYYLNSINYKDYVSGTTRLKLTQAQMKRILIPVPSIEEQERIVAKIEELFSDLDNAVETLNATKAQLEVYRRAVLKESFFGDYPKKTLGEISKTISGYAFKSSKYTPDGKYTVIKIGNVKDRHFDFSRDHTLTNEVNETILEKYLMRKGDCLITLTGSRGKRDYGFVTMIDKQTNFLLNQRVAALRFDEEYAIPEFYQYYLSSSDYREKFFSYETGNVGQGNVGVKALTEPLVICPPKEEQKTIITKIESRLSMCEQIENTVTSALVQASAMRQSILKQAFEGRLLNGK